MQIGSFQHANCAFSDTSAIYLPELYNNENAALSKYTCQVLHSQPLPALHSQQWKCPESKCYSWPSHWFLKALQRWPSCSDNTLFSSYYLKCYLAVQLSQRLSGKTEAVSLKAQSHSQYCTHRELKLHEFPLQQGLSICHITCSDKTFWEQVSANGAKIS